MVRWSVRRGVAWPGLARWLGVPWRGVAAVLVCPRSNGRAPCNRDDDVGPVAQTAHRIVPLSVDNRLKPIASAGYS